MTAQHDPATPMPTISLVMPTISWEPPFACCLEAAMAGLAPSDQLLVVFDGAAPDIPAWLKASGAIVLHTGLRRGPAGARNLGAERAAGEVLLFVDADVELHPDAIARMRQQFGADPGLQALFGSYDDRPAAPGVVSRFRNLLHHHTHTSQPGPASTFWAGCGAVRRERFLALGGFDADAYTQPCIEDIEFGLRLHDDGGKILLDPTIQGTHHKRWTFSLMVRTDIQQRAIPWSRLLLSRRELPATLNLSGSARMSAGLSAGLALALAAIGLPSLAPWPQVIAGGAFVLLLALNRSFLALLHRQGGIRLAVTGGLLHVLYLLYSSLSFAAVLIGHWLNTPLNRPAWLKKKPAWGKTILWTAVILMGFYNIYSLSKGAYNLATGGDAGGWHLKDLTERYDEWILFRDQIYPHSLLASGLERLHPNFRTSVYLPWALPMLGGLFAWGGLIQGKVIILLANLAGIAITAAAGKYCFKPLGNAASWFGAFLPLSIRGLNFGLTLGQFSGACVGLVTLQWLLLHHKKPLPAGLCWALAMIKPQIALTFALPMINTHYRKGLLFGGGILVALSAVALWHTSTNPIDFFASWLQTLNHFAALSPNLTGALATIDQDFWKSIKAAFVGTSAVLISCIYIALRQSKAVKNWCIYLTNSKMSMELAGISAISGAVLFYHEYYDNIMLYPALLCCWLTSLKSPKLGNLILSILITLSLSAPLILLAGISTPVYKIFQATIWILAGIVFLLRIVQGKAEPIALAN